MPGGREGLVMNPRGGAVTRPGALAEDTVLAV